MDGTALRGGSESQAAVGPLAETDPSSTNTQLPRPATHLPFDVQNGLKSGAGKDLKPKSQHGRSESSGETAREVVRLAPIALASNNGVVEEPEGARLPVSCGGQATECPSLPEEPLASVGVEILLPEVERATANGHAALRGQNCPRPQPELCTRGRAKPQNTGYFIDTPENLEIPEATWTSRTRSA